MITLIVIICHALALFFATLAGDMLAHQQHYDVMVTSLLIAISLTGLAHNLTIMSKRA